MAREKEERWRREGGSLFPAVACGGEVGEGSETSLGFLDFGDFTFFSCLKNCFILDH